MANLAFVVFWRRLSIRILTVVIALGAAGLIAIVLVYGQLSGGNLWATAATGPVRVMFSFFLGVIIQRIVPRSPARSHLIGPFCAAFLIVLFALRPGAWTGLYHLICVLLIFPALGVLAMRIDVDGVGALVFKKLGDASYGIYVLHMPTLILVSWIASHSGGSAGPRGPAIFLVSCSLLFTVVLALDRWFDRPARFWMTRRMGLEFKRANLAAPPI